VQGTFLSRAGAANWHALYHAQIRQTSCARGRDKLHCLARLRRLALKAQLWRASSVRVHSVRTLRMVRPQQSVHTTQVAACLHASTLAASASGRCTRQGASCGDKQTKVKPFLSTFREHSVQTVGTSLELFRLHPWGLPKTPMRSSKARKNTWKCTAQTQAWFIALCAQRCKCLKSCSNSTAPVQRLCRKDALLPQKRRSLPKRAALS